MSALDVLLQALAISPDNTVLRKHVADELYGKERYEEALEQYRILYEASDEDESVLENLVGLLISKRELDEALELVEKALARDGEWASGHISIARILYEKKQYNEAMEHYNKALEIDEELKDEELYENLSRHANRQKQKVKVIDMNTRMAFGDDFERPRMTFNDVGGMDEVKENIRMNIIFPLQNPSLYQAYGRKPGGGILLYGPPGCGKTFIARATAGECRANFINIAINDILDMYVGESEKNLHTLFETARYKTPSIIFIDEIDAIGGSRQTMVNSVGRTLTNQLLVELDGIYNNNENLLFIGATNSPWFVDSALKRPGRFDRILFIPPPDLKARVEILKLHLKDRPCMDIDYVKVVKSLNNYSGADLRNICEIASENAIKKAIKTGKIVPLQTSDLIDASRAVKPSTIEWLNTAKNYATYSNQGGIYDDILEYLKKQ